ncbi:MAG: DUF1592 domain-containing protein, partial [Verrucomicrobiales bacterium]|nr:DUF1592 domain-containing protein [Verrucomicrobiales bacterium]
SEIPGVFSVLGFDDVKSENLGYFEVGKETKEFQIEAELGAKGAVQFFAHGLPLWVNEPKIEKDAAIGFSSVTLTGPLYETWPPEQHTDLLGTIDPEFGRLDDAKQIFEKLMPRAYRRPVDDEDVARPVKLVREALATGRSFEESLRLGLESILCSPNLLFLREDKTEKLIDEYELASRLSFFLWNSMPDGDLFESARTGILSDPATLQAQVDRMLQDHKSSRFVENFTGQWLKLREIEATTPDSKLYSGFDEVLQISMVDESLFFFRKLLDDDLPITNFIDSRFLMLNRRLARHYDIPGVEGLEVKPVDIPDDSVRGGLKVTANGTNTSPVMRGVWVLENILGKHIPPPPPNIAGIEPDIREATTIREQLDLHRNAESCAGCHQYIDPPGFALESFDPIGGYRERYLQFKVNPQHADKGWGSVVKAKPVNASGKFANGDSFEDIKQFKALLLANSDQFASCLTERLATYALGRELGFSDREPIRQIVEQTKAEGNGFRTLIKNLVISPLFSQP